jgi:hypothetical protein
MHEAWNILPQARPVRILELTEEALATENAELRELVEAYRIVAQVALSHVADITNDRLRDLRRENAELRALLMMRDMDVAA